VRRPDPDDQRISRVYLTEAGRAIKTQVEQVWETMEIETFAGFSPEEQVVLHGFLTRLRDNLEKVTENKKLS